MDIEKKALVTESQEIIDGILNGSSVVLDRLYQLYFPMVVKLVTRNNGTEDDAKDIFQEALMVLYDKIQRKDLTLSSSFKTYLYAVCKNLWLKSLYKKDRYMYSISDLEDSMLLEEDISIHAEADRLFSSKFFTCHRKTLLKGFPLSVRHQLGQEQPVHLQMPGKFRICCAHLLEVCCFLRPHRAL